MQGSNQDVANLLRSVAAALTLKGKNTFQIRAYETAADGIEHSSAELSDLWQEGKLGEIPGVGKGIEEYLDEYFKTGKVTHFESLMKDIPPAVFELIQVPGVGPKTALELAKLGVKGHEDLERKISSGELVKKGFSGKISEKIYSGLSEFKNRSGRMLLPFAQTLADKILEYLRKSSDVIDAHVLGSLRRQVATVGDLDFSAASDNPKKVVDYFVKYPGVKKVLDQGENKATIILSSGVQSDLLVGDKKGYGALLQHFTGSKHHNIKLRSLALEKGLSLSEYGVKKIKNQNNTPLLRRPKIKTEKIIETKTEAEFYQLLGMEIPPPEIREDTGEIEAAVKHELPKLVELKDTKGDLHSHGNFPMVHPSHGPGVNSMEDIIKKAIDLGYEYVGISDHPPGFRTVSEKEMLEILERRSKKIDQLRKKFKKIRVLNGLEIDILPDGTLSVPNEILDTLDYCIAGVHSVHRMEKDKMTKRLLRALENPFVDILAHPTGRLLNERDSSDADWEEIFKFCKENKKLLEINAFPNRLDLRDDLVREANELGCNFIINTDAHEVSQMGNMRFGVSVARRGWTEAKSVVNTWDWKKLTDWFRMNKTK